MMVNRKIFIHCNSIVLMLLLAIVSSINTYGQKLARISFDEMNRNNAFPALIKPLTKEEKFAFIYPYHLSYYGSKEQIINEIFGVSTSFGIKAKYNDSQPDYWFELKMNGIENIVPLPARWHNDNVGGPKGFVKDITYNFPCSVVVKNKEGKVLRKIEIFGKDQEFKAVYHQGYFTGAFSPFGAAASADSSVKFKLNAIGKMLESQIAASAYAQSCLALVYLFNDYNTSKLTYSIAGVKQKGREADFSELDNLNEKLKATMDSYFTGNTKASEDFKKLLSDYEALLASNKPGIDDNVKDALHYNMSICCMLLEDFAGSWDHYNKSTMKKIDVGEYYKRELRDRISLYQFRNTVSKSVGE